MTLLFVVLGWLLIAAATVRASIAWGSGVAAFVLVFLAAFRLLVPYGDWFTDSAALLVAWQAPPRLL